MGKPSEKELWRKLNAAKAILAEVLRNKNVPKKGPGMIRPIDPYKFDLEWERLEEYLELSPNDYQSFFSRLEFIHECLKEATPENHRWVGYRPKCNKPSYDDLELWEFIWECQRWPEKPLYVKFGLREKGLLFLSFHPQEPDRAVGARENYGSDESN